MADVTTTRNTRRKITPWDMIVEYEVATGATIVQGTAVGFDSNGKLVPISSAAAGKPAAGRACSGVTSAAAGTLLKVDIGIFAWDISGTNALTDANRYGQVWFEDNHTVGSLNTGFKLGGILEDIEGTVAWVAMNPFRGVAA